MAIIGAILGDIAGSQYEFPSWRPNDLDWQNCELFTDECEFTDDTVMTIATKVALDKYNGDFEKAYREFGKIYPDVGYGDMFLKWIMSNDPIMYNSFGNGSAMRVSYIGDFKNDLVSVYSLAERSARCTHGSKSGISGAVVTANTIAMANTNHTKSEIYNFTYQIYPDVSKPLDEIRRRYVWSETCDGTVPVAIRCFLESKDYENCLRNCFSLNCDMDTMCCIAGGIAEAYYKTTGFDNEKILKKYLDDRLFKLIKEEIK